MPSTPARPRVLGDHPQPGACFIFTQTKSGRRTPKLGAPPPSHPGESGERAKLNGRVPKLRVKLEPQIRTRGAFQSASLLHELGCSKHLNFRPHVCDAYMCYKSESVRARSGQWRGRGLVRPGPFHLEGTPELATAPRRLVEPSGEPSPAVRVLPGPPPSQSTHTALGSHTLTHSTNLNGPINVWLSPIIYQWLVLLRSTCLRMASAANWLGLGLGLGRR